MAIRDLLESFEERETEVFDPEEETFFLFSQPIPSQNLGFVDPKAPELDVPIAGRDYTMRQSPGVLASNREGGTTGAVLWKITPLFASWLASPTNQILPAVSPSPSPPPSAVAPNDPRPCILELGCGISALTALAAAPLVSDYVLTDQSYVSRLVQQNIDENKATVFAAAAARSSGNQPRTSQGSRTSRKDRKREKATGATTSTTTTTTATATATPYPLPSTPGTISFTPLDWELDLPAPPLTGNPSRKSFDAVLACDCIYNEALVEPFVQTCADACRLRDRENDNRNGNGPASGSDESTRLGPTLCVVAQQLRSPDVFEAWLREFHAKFRAWRVPDDMLDEGLRVGSGFAVHVGVLRHSS